MIKLIKAWIKKELHTTHYVRTDMVNMVFTAQTYGKLLCAGEVPVVGWTRAHLVGKGRYITLTESGKKTGIYIIKGEK